MKGLIDKVITLHEMRADAMGILVANTQKALGQFVPDGWKTTSEQIERLDNRVKDLTSDVSDMLTRFWFQKERKQKEDESMTRDQVKNLADFATFAKTFAKEARSLLDRVEKSRSQTFEEKFDKEVRQMETCVKGRLKQFDETLEETLAGARSTWKERLKKYVGKGA